MISQKFLFEIVEMLNFYAVFFTTMGHEFHPMQFGDFEGQEL